VSEHFTRPNWLLTNVYNRGTAALMGLGVSVAGEHMLEVSGRTSGEPRRTPVFPLDHEGQRYLVAPRGTTHWVRNLRASGEGRLILGSSSEDFAAVELTDAEKIPVLRAYLKRYRPAAQYLFKGVKPSSPEERWLQEAPKYPVFRI
jgi:deazaflavin-dependent oxidoreductase (nitroreductase family)